MQRSAHPFWHSGQGTGSAGKSSTWRGWLRLTLPLGISMVLWYGIWLIVRTQL